MKFNFAKHIKIWIIVTLAVIVAGAAMLVFLGANNTVDYSSSYEVQVEVEQALGDVSTIMEETSNKYFKDNNIAVKDYSFQSENDGQILIYKLSSSLTKAQTDALEQLIKNNADFQANYSSLDLTVTCYQVVTNFDNQFGWALLALGLAFVAAFVYLAFRHKIAAALTSLGISLIGVALFIAVVGIARIPLLNTFVAVAFGTAILSMILTTGVMNRIKEEGKNVANAKLSNIEIASLSISKGAFRIIAVCASLALAGILMIILGPTYIRIIGLQIVAAAVVSAFASFAFTSNVWAILKSNIKTKKKPVKDKSTNNEKAVASTEKTEA